MDSSLNLQINRATLPVQVADRIQDLIETEALHMGDRLPSERDLAERLGVSRPVIRESLQVLSERGLVRIKPGCGTFVQEPSTQHAADYLELYFKLRLCPGSLHEFFEMRQLLEVETAGLAAERAVSGDIAALDATIANMQSQKDSLAGFISADLEFHLGLAHAAHNEYLLMILGPLANIWSQVISISAKAPGAVQAGIDYHRDIITHITQHDVLGARESMRRHMYAALEFSEAAQQTEESSGYCI